MRLRLVVAATFIAATTVLHAQAPPPTTPESLVLAAKRAAGQDYAGTFLRICVAPYNLATGTAGRGGRGAANAVPAARVVPDRATWYAQPYKVFDNLYFIGTRIHSAWALTTSDGIIVIDTLFDYAIEPEIVEGLSGLGLNPRDIKYVVISHAHGDHDQGAALLQSRYGAKVVMGVADWDATSQRPSTAAGGVPKRDVGVGPEGRNHARRHDAQCHRHTRSHAWHALVHLSGERPGPHADGGLFRRHGLQFPAPGAGVRRVSRQPEEDGRCRAHSGSHHPHVQSHRVRSCV
jgi:hypothetical protein